jgi:hypothetical protein
MVRDLQVVAVTSSGTHLVVADEAGEQFRLSIDDRLRAAVRGEPVRAGQLEISLTSQLSPRDIQTRVRAGASVDEVADAAGVSPDRVLRFAAPVLDERSHMAAQATRALVRTEGQRELGQLGPVVTATLGARDLAETLRWDAWRRDDGRWLVVSRWAESDQERSALWLLDPSGGSVSALDDAARSLAGLGTEVQPAPTPARLAVVRDDVPAPADPVAEQDETPTGPIPLLDAPGTPAASSAREPSRRRPRSTAPADDDRLWLSDIAPSAAEKPAAGSGAEPPTRRQRPAVPSWDEIMFGRRG